MHSGAGIPRDRSTRQPRFGLRAIRLVSMLAASALSAACADSSPPPPGPTAADHVEATDAWHATRIAALRQPVGWLSLAGLYWIEPGENSFGSSPSSAFVYDPPGRSLPSRIGSFTLADSVVTFNAADGVLVEDASGRVTSAVMHAEEDPAILRSGSLEWRVIRRNDRLAVRLWDTLAVTRTTFPGIERFPVSLAYRIPARFIPRDPPDTLDIPNVLGTINRTPSPASVEFEYAGRMWRLMTWKDSDDPANFFTAFGDATNGATTYGGGRFLWIDAPDESGWTVVDFNRAYNPPCVFTDYATCPLPPRPNRFPFVIEAGEKAFSAAAEPPPADGHGENNGDPQSDQGHDGQAGGTDSLQIFR